MNYPEVNQRWIYNDIVHKFIVEVSNILPGSEKTEGKVVYTSGIYLNEFRSDWSIKNQLHWKLLKNQNK